MHVCLGAMSAEEGSVGVTVVTGFLGSGKSTLIRRILTENHGLRVVVVENEFGSTAGVESAIVTQGVGESALEDFIELPNGCICCSAQEDLTSALSFLVREKRNRIDHILVETSGLADPGPVAASFWVDEQLETQLRLDAVVTIVDAFNILSYLTTAQKAAATKSRLAEKQVAVADVVIVNKTDLLREHDSTELASGEAPSLSGVLDSVNRINSTAQVIPAQKCNVPLRQILNIHAYDTDSARREAERFSGHISHVSLGAAAMTLTFADVFFDDSALDRAIGTLLWERPEETIEDSSEQTSHQDLSDTQDIWRMKALVFIKGEPCLRVYQAVHTLFDSDETDVQVSARDVVQSQFVFIGRSLRKEKLREALATAVASDG